MSLSSLSSPSSSASHALPAAPVDKGREPATRGSAEPRDSSEHSEYSLQRRCRTERWAHEARCRACDAADGRSSHCSAKSAKRRPGADKHCRRMDVEGRERCAQGRQATNRRCVLPRGVAVAVVRLEILITLYPACLPAMHGSHRSEPCSASAFEDGVRRVRRVRRVPCCAGCDRLAESVGARMRQPEYVALLRWRCM